MKFFHQYHGTTQIIHNQKLNFEPHLHSEVEIIALFKGEATVTVNDKSLELGEGEFLVVAPNTIHSYVAKSEVDVGKFIFDPETVPEIGKIFRDKAPINPKVCKETSEKADLAALAHEIINRYKDSSSLVKKAYITLLTGKLLELCGLEEKQGADHDTIGAVFEYCQNNYRENITQRDIAQALHISESHLSHIFCCKMKINFRSYINILRTNEACRLILGTDKSIIEIAEESGFSGPRSFNRAFVKNVGMTPTQYRKSYAGKTGEEFWNDRFFMG